MHSICPYFAMFPETFAEHWIGRLTSPGDFVLDPFSGRGTAPFQALLMGRKVIATDVNPVAYCLTRAKLHRPDLRSVRSRITRLENSFSTAEVKGTVKELPEFFSYAFEASTLRQVVYLRKQLDWRRSDTDCMIAALVMGSLHGESKVSPSYFSNQMPRTISTKPNYSIRFWKKHRLSAPKRDVFPILRQRAELRYSQSLPSGMSLVYHGDMRELPFKKEVRRQRVRLALTSPPYLNVTNFEEDQWLRLWFLGGAGFPSRNKFSRDDRHLTKDRYWNMIGDLWRTLGSVMDENSHFVVRIGGKDLSEKMIVSGLQGTSVLSGRKVRLLSTSVSSIKKRQTEAFTPGTKGCGFEVDCHFRFK